METESRRHVNAAALPPTSPVSSTTFVQADAATFRDLVQRLTGLSPDSEIRLPVTLPSRIHAPKQGNYNNNNSNNGNGNHPPVNSPRRSPYKLQERRHTIRKLEIKLSRASLRNNNSSGASPCSSPCLVESPIASPVTPLMGSGAGESPFFSSTETSPSTPCSEEERAIAEKRFYLHPSPLSTPRGSEPPELLPLFPLSSPTTLRI
ncbi:unnamed protein product [Linum tenue]|uniref:VQ domain-containing protein n=1 Tax=Linum tenue TaxID=586396 RepID=A0AAV0GUC2_9ROSI|nr:unnamed protein product [Linum tenue]